MVTSYHGYCCVLRRLYGPMVASIAGHTQKVGDGCGYRMRGCELPWLLLCTKEAIWT